MKRNLFVFATLAALSALAVTTPVHADALDDPYVQDLIAQALATTKWPLDPAEPQRLIIKSVSAKQRPRRPKS